MRNGRLAAKFRRAAGTYLTSPAPHAGTRLRLKRRGFARSSPINRNGNHLPVAPDFTLPRRAGGSRRIRVQRIFRGEGRPRGEPSGDTYRVAIRCADGPPLVDRLNADATATLPLTREGETHFSVRLVSFPVNNPRHPTFSDPPPATSGSNAGVSASIRLTGPPRQSAGGPSRRKKLTFDDFHQNAAHFHHFMKPREPQFAVPFQANTIAGISQFAA